MDGEQCVEPSLGRQVVLDCGVAHCKAVGYAGSFLRRLSSQVCSMICTMMTRCRLVSELEEYEEELDAEVVI